MRRLFWPLGLAAALLCPHVVRAQAPDILSLEQALALATARSPMLSAARHELQAQDGAVQQAGVRRNPEFSASIEDTRSASRTTTATLGFPLELGGKRAARTGAAERARELARAELDNATAQVRASVAAAYVGVLIAQERAKLAANSAQLAAGAAQATAKRVGAGKLSPVDATRALVDQANAQLEATEAQAELNTARHALAGLWGDTEPRFSSVAEGLDPMPQRAPLAELASGLEAAPALRAARAEIDRRNALIDIERSQGVPDLMLSIGARRDNELGRTQAVVGMSMPLPLFDRQQGAVLEASRRAAKAQDDYEATRLRVLTELQAACTQLAVARDSLQALQTTVLPAAQQAHDAASKGFDAGKFAFLDVIDAQRSLLQTRARYLRTLSTAHQAATTIDRLLGR